VSGNARTNRTPSTRAGGEKDWGPKFLAAFTEELTISGACKVAGVGRTTVYDRLDRDPRFAAEFHERDEAITDAMEHEAYRRGVIGVERPVYQGGAEVGRVREYSDRLLELGLRARRRDKYSSKIEVKDTREERERREIERMSDEELKHELTGMQDNVIDIETRRRDGTDG
jgi:hypothetical protein